MRNEGTWRDEGGARREKYWRSKVQQGRERKEREGKKLEKIEQRVEMTGRRGKKEGAEGRAKEERRNRKVPGIKENRGTIEEERRKETT